MDCGLNRDYRISLADDDVLLFIHIPKTGGLSFIQILDEKFHSREIFPLHSAPSPKPFRTFSSKHLKQYRLVRGHYRFGPFDQRVYKHVTQNPICITMLRDPVQRTISEYRYILRNPNSPIHERLVSRRMTLMEFVCEPMFSGWVVNRQARVLFGGYPGFPFHNDAKKTLSEEAILHVTLDRIEQFALVGVTERFEESVKLLSETFGWTPPDSIPRLNVTPEWNKQGEVTQEVIEAIKERTRIDRELHKRAVEVLDRRRNLDNKISMEDARS